MSKENGINQESSPNFRTETVPFQELVSEYTDPMDVGIANASVTVTKVQSPDQATYTALVHLELGPKKFRDLLEGSSPKRPAVLRPLDKMRDYMTPHAMQDIYESLMFEGKPIPRGHQIVDLEAFRKDTTDVLTADPLEPEDVIGYHMTTLYSTAQVKHDLLKQEALTPHTIRAILFSNTNPDYYRRLLQKVQLTPRYTRNSKTNAVEFFPSQQRSNIVNAVRKSPALLAEIIDTSIQTVSFTDEEIDGIIERYAFLEYGGYIKEDANQDTVIFGIGDRQEVSVDTDAIHFRLGNLSISAKLESTIGQFGKAKTVVPFEASFRKSVLAGMSWSTDRFGNREWDFMKPSGENVQPILGLIMLSYLNPEMLDPWHPNHAIQSASFTPARVAMQQESLLQHQLLKNTEKILH